MAIETKKQETPPYASYSTFSNFINGLKGTGVPSRIDKSVLSKMSGSAQAALLSALKWLNLIDAFGVPTPSLEQLIAAEEDSFSKVLGGVLTESYPFMSDGSLDLAKATGSQVEQKFRDFGIQGSTIVKSVAFFIAAAKEAKIALGPHIKTPKVQSSSNGSKRQSRKIAPPMNADQGKRDAPPDDDDAEVGFEDKPGFMRITIPLHGMGDGAIYLPADMGPRARAYALKITKFLLDNYWLDDDTQTAIEQIEKEDP